MFGDTVLALTGSSFTDEPASAGAQAAPYSAPLEPSSWRFDEFALDAARYELRREGHGVPIEPQVFDVLVHLVSNHHRVVGRQELMDAIWGAGYGSEASLSTRMKEARRALGDTGESQRYIRTVRGRGYRFVAVPTPIEAPRVPRTPASVPAQRVDYVHARNGVRLAYGVTGSGPPLVRAATWLTHLGYDADSSVWRHWLADLSARRTLIRYDERGCGLSDRDVGPFVFDDWVHDLETVVDTLELDTFPLLGISQGGAVAMTYAAQHPERVSKLILVGAFAQGRAVRAVGEAEQHLAKLDIDLARLGWERQDPAFRKVFAAQFQPQGTREDWDDFDRFQRRTTNPENAVRFIEQFSVIDVLDAARSVTCPTLIVHARDDHRVPQRCSHQLRAAISNARLVTLESMNHLFTAQEAAWPAFLDELDQFLDDCPHPPKSVT
ncbi:alpha/beta fold hydrolase [Mycolicibacterium sp. Dal123E01]|uniref:alpha/beta fold hydrolase n=1 Tax=Mycolicibacterium sp. Dal123E01 TaxID=3457578 RepID=UPI00403E8597